MALSNVKVQDIAKDLKVTNKDIIEKLSNFGITLKSGASVLEEEHLGLIMDLYTQAYDMGDTPIIKPKVKAPIKQEEPKKEEPKEVKKESQKVAEKPAPKKDAPAQKTAEKKDTTSKAPQKDDKKAEDAKAYFGTILFLLNIIQ